MEEIKIGIVGFGWWGQILAQYFREFPDVKVVAVCKRRKDFSLELLQDAHYYPDMEEMFEKEKMDGVVIATPPETHYFPTKFAAERGIHIFCEKPMAHTLEDCDRMIEICQKNKVKLLIAFKHRFSKAFSYLKERSLEFGKPLWAMYTYPLWKVDDPGWKFQEDGTKGIIVENVVHAIDGLIYLMGDVERVYAEGNRVVFKHPTLPDSTIFTLRFKNGAIAAIGGGCTSDRRISREYLDIHFEKGLAQIWGNLDYPFNLRLLERDKEEIEEYTFEGSDGVREEIAYFLRCIREDKEVEICDGKEGKKSLEVALAVLESIKKNQVIELGG
ncbi:Gfo/Idh/MocA family oxidoreductase [Candidatus Calescamantes bacterium]|nr:Gfo/Idh/MocA family oxidoreductase [Candidatus Calescamantes bacterium]